MADKKNLCAMIPADLHARVRLEQEQSGKLFFRLRLPFERLRQPGQTCTDRLLVRANFCFVKQILRQKLLK